MTRASPPSSSASNNTAPAHSIIILIMIIAIMIIIVIAGKLRNKEKKACSANAQLSDDSRPPADSAPAKQAATIHPTFRHNSIARCTKHMHARTLPVDAPSFFTHQNNKSVCSAHVAPRITPGRVHSRAGKSDRREGGVSRGNQFEAWQHQSITSPSITCCAFPPLEIPHNLSSPFTKVTIDMNLNHTVFTA